MVTEWNPELLESADYRSALGRILAQFMHGETVSFEVVPLLIDSIDDEDLLVQLQRQLDDEKRHLSMFDAQRHRLNLPNLPPTESITNFGDKILRMQRQRDVVGCILVGSFMLEGIAFSTLMAHREVVEPELAEDFGEILADEGRHISLNLAILRRMIDRDATIVERLVELHRETLPEMFDIFRTAAGLNETIGADNDWLSLKSLFHHAQRIHRLHLPREASRSMLEDVLRLTPKSPEGATVDAG